MERRGEVEKENLRQADLSRERESRIYQALLESPDPEIKAAAMTGLLDVAQPPRRKKGLRGWMGEMEAAPAYARIKQLIDTPVEIAPGRPAAPGLPSTQIQGTVGPPPQVAPMGTPSRSLTEPGAPPAPPPTYQERLAPGSVGRLPAAQIQATMGAAPTVQGTPPPQDAVGPPPGPMPRFSTRQVPGPAVGRPAQPPTFGSREIFPSPERQAQQKAEGVRQETLAREQAETQAELERWEQLPPELKEIELQKRRGGMAGTQEGNVHETAPGSGIWAQDLWDKGTGKVVGQIPAQPPAWVTAKPNPQQMAAAELYGQAGETPPQTLLRISREPNGTQKLAEVTKRLAERGIQYKVDEKLALGQVITPQEYVQTGQSLRRDWEKASGSYTEMRRQYTLMEIGVKRFAEGDRGAGSQAVLVTFQRILDPDSVVRESEYARSPAGLPLTTRLQELYDRYIGKWDPATQRWIGGGAGVPESELREMVETARQFLSSMEEWNRGEENRIRSFAERAGIDPAHVIAATPGSTPPASSSLSAPSGPPNLFVGPDGKLHVGSPTGPLYTGG